MESITVQTLVGMGIQTLSFTENYQHLEQSYPFAVPHCSLMLPNVTPNKIFTRYT